MSDDNEFHKLKEKSKKESSIEFHSDHSYMLYATKL